MIAPPLYTDLPTPEEMRRWDENALTRYGIPPLLLMENAARAALAALQDFRPLAPGSRILVFMGRGNNGGDGAALARLLHDEGHAVLVCAVGEAGKMGGPAGEHVRMALKMGVNFLPAAAGAVPALPADWSFPDVLVDAITGTGIKGELRDPELALVRAINSRRENSFILSLDIPSGLCGLGGQARPEAVRAHLTVTFEAGKPGLYFPEARAYTGRIEPRRVGIPLALRAAIPPSWRLLEPQKGTWALPSPFRHKGEAGRTLVIGGSEGMAGAPLLSALGSLRAGAGLAHAAVPAALEPAFRSACPEVLVHPIGRGACWEGRDAAPLAALIRDVAPHCLVLGPGMGRGAGAREIVRAVLAAGDRPPAIVDADALFFFSLPGADGQGRSDPEARAENNYLPLDLLAETDVLTPHSGEMARLLPDSFFAGPSDRSARNLGQDLGKEPPEGMSMRRRVNALRKDRAGAVRAFARACESVLVLKGPGTLIGRRGAPTTLSPVAAPTLAVGGSGDVLAGVCAALIAGGVFERSAPDARGRPGHSSPPFRAKAEDLPAQGSASLDAACLAVYLHGRAGELLAEKAPCGHLARDIADAIPLAWKELCPA